MGLFLSYSSRDRAGIDDLLSALHRAQEDVWFDEDLGGGQAWWQMILERIRSCDVFVFAMSQNSLDSKPCQAELRYAQSLGKPVLPIQIGPVGSMRVTPLAAVEVIDFQHPTVETGIQLMTAVQDARRRANPLPSPLPDEPPVPFAYLMRVAAAVAEADLDPQEQTELIGRLRTAVHEDGGDPTTRGDIVQLLRTLRDRPDATEQTRIEAIAMLKALGESSHPQAASRPRGSKKWLIGVAAVAVCAVAAVAIIVLTRGKPESTAAQPGTAGSGAASSGASTASSTAPPAVPSQKLDAILLSPEEMATVMGAATMQADPVSNSLFNPPDNFDPQECLGADSAAINEVYAGSGYSKVRYQRMTEPDPKDPANQSSAVAEQAAVIFPSAHLATAFLDTSAQQWAGCKDQGVKQTVNGDAVRDTIGPVTRTGDSISLLVSMEASDGWDCQHTLTASSNLVLEATACRPDIQIDDVNQAGQIVAKMLEKAGA